MTRITQMGVTTAVPAKFVDPQAREALRQDVQDLGEQMQPRLRQYVGGIDPEGPLAVDWAGPVDDPLQGSIYALTLAGPFDVDKLPATCQAYLDFNAGQGGTTQTDGDPTVVNT